MSKREHSCSQEQFLEDVADHAMTVVRDDGLYRHLQLRSTSRGSAYWFNVVTWPGTLVIEGDCGTYVFRRDPDMFDFFRPHRSDPGIKPGYWAGKATATDGSIKVFEFETFKADVRAFLDAYAEDREDAERCARIRSACLDELAHVEPDQHAAVTFIREFTFEGFHFCDWERESREFAFHYIWNCYAVQWAIARYDALKAAGREAANDDGSERVAA